MPTYLIHAYPKRMWYVTEYLIPSLVKQDIPKENIRVYNDENGEGNLISCMKAFASCKGDGGTWHLQDDVCICKDFKERTEKYDSGIVCGFSSWYDVFKDRNGGPGEINVERMWFSFPCIRIPNEWARNCAEWVTNDIIGNPVYEDYWKLGRNDDWCFRKYVKQFHPDCKALNLSPNLVDHVDYLLGGGSGGKRNKPVRAQYWHDEDVVKKLEQDIVNSRRF